MYWYRKPQGSSTTLSEGAQFSEASCTWHGHPPKALYHLEDEPQDKSGNQFQDNGLIRNNERAN